MTALTQQGCHPWPSNLAHGEACSGGGFKAVETLFIIPRGSQPAREYGAAARTVHAAPPNCPHGHAYTADSATIAWEPCPCWPATGGGHHLISGHHLITCRPCRQRRLPALVNVPECIYLGF
jgi:hypothetical protein